MIPFAITVAIILLLFGFAAAFLSAGHAILAFMLIVFLLLSVRISVSR